MPAGLSMPIAPKRPCPAPGCRALVDKGYCDQHRRDRQRAYNSTASRQADQKFYKGRRWLAVRAAHLQDEPLCRACRKVGRMTAATHVDHIIPRTAGGADYDESNLQSLCMPCHSAKTRREERQGAGQIPTTF
jgi:5-methylcytosine-specific restriction protein A